MILGIDVGGTHTDAVLLDHYEVKKKAKVLTNSENLLDSLLKVTEEILSETGPEILDRVVLSTTMSTNAIVQDRISKVGMILASGPGLPPSMLTINDDTHFVSGYVNHRGVEVVGIDRNEVAEIEGNLRDKGIEHVGIVGKFSSRDPAIETDIGDTIESSFRHISLGHRMSGNLNFPRRIATTYLNAAVWDIYNSFIHNIEEFVGRFKTDFPIYILKADGGTFEISQSAKCPVQTILSGPAASIMGIMSLTDCSEDAIALDIGGTTTDIAIFAGGIPLLEPLGVTIKGHKTLIRGLRTRSIGIGGDSRITYENGELTVGPERMGPAAAFGGPFPTPTDAMIVLGLTDIGEREKANHAMAEIAGAMNTTPQEAAERVFATVCEEITTSVKDMVDEINNAPVYTVHEMFEGKKIDPALLYVVGGPAQPMASRLGELLGCTAHIPENAEVANAIGASLARTTTELTVLADTEKGTLTIVEEGLQSAISREFTREDALRICMDKLRERAIKMGAQETDLEIEVTEDQSFNMVRGYYTAGKNIRVKAQVKPGLISNFNKGKTT